MHPSHHKDFLIRVMHLSDIPKIVKQFRFPWSTPEKTQKKWETYYHEQEEKKRIVALIEKDSEILGYGSFLRKSKNNHFSHANIPEIHDVWIDKNERRKGLGKALINWIETLAIDEGYHQLGIGVGLYQDYGPAQILYIQLGYLPDGQGVTYKSQRAIPGKSYPLDDDFLLWLIKTLK